MAFPKVPRANLSADCSRRLGDPTPLPGDFEHCALTKGPAVRRRWRETKLELLEWFFIPKADEKILDIGCGSGVFASRMVKLFEVEKIRTFSAFAWSAVAARNPE